MAKWISINDRLPESETKILIWGPGFAIEDVYVGEDSFKKDENGIFFFEDMDEPITHWMPLPEPPYES